MQRTQNEEQEGWVGDVFGMRHFSGMRCPDIVGPFFRTKTLAADSDRMAGCLYTGRDGMQAVVRQHLAGTGRQAASAFLDNYRAAGFELVSMSGVAERGISFKTQDWGGRTQIETLWHFAGREADFSLWIAYSLPAQEAEVGPAVAAFEEMLAQQN
ncbi:hypothetical protein GCM10011316_06700 [Roseibium aquae]|uniref:Uncharacterized protein n=1 Tax=Roseibium aquae TaxID=1323746 RepID=A0A916T9W7_9HYPH|nr:hypothetical protein [Roseibium aquae]GGB37249.1 hypothetical protein GCM10011316_06700 [Roseibium aquae]